MKNNLFFILCLLCLIGCGDDKPAEVRVPVLNGSMIYRAHKVQEYMNKYGDQHKTLASSYYKRAKKLVDVNPEKAIWCIKRAITLHPTLPYYKEVIQLLIDRKQYLDAHRLLDVISTSYSFENALGGYDERFVFDKPDFDTYYNYLISEYLVYGYISAYEIQKANDLDIDIKKIKAALLDDKRFTLKEGTEPYEEFMLSFLNEDEIKMYCSSQSNFEKFMNNIPDLMETFNLDKSRLTKFNYQNFNDRDYEEGGQSLTHLTSYFLKEAQVNPDNWLVYNTIGKRKLNDQVWLLLYAIDTSATACPAEMRHIYYTLAAYKPTGEIIATKQIAWQTDVSYATAAINQNSVIVTEYKRVWKKPYDKTEFDNELLATNKLYDTELQINNDGQVLKVSPSAD